MIETDGVEIPDNVVFADFSAAFRTYVVAGIRRNGRDRYEESMIAGGWHPSFVRAIVRSVLRKEGW